MVFLSKFISLVISSFKFIANRLLLESVQKIQKVDLNKMITSIDEKYRLVLKGILSATQYRNKINVHYSNEWILMCILFHIKSPAGNNFILNSNILPLPRIQTIRKYLSMIDTKCSFDDKFL